MLDYINLKKGDEMKEEINFGIGFITGRDNICKIINSYYRDILKQVEELEQKVNFTFYILYDVNYLNIQEEEFYKIDPEVRKFIKIKHLSPEYVFNKKNEVMYKHGLTEEEANLIIGKGYAKSRNSILYDAIEDGIDYLLYWDDDEYPIAAIKEKNGIQWIEQKNIVQHIKYIEKVDVTYGHRCGIINPLPYIEYNKIVTEEVYKKFIDAMENDAVSWEKIKKVQEKEENIGYADKRIANYENVKFNNGEKDSVVYGSGLCLNLTHIDNIPAFYNPPYARGEDTFFSCTLKEIKADVLQIPVYHFHDAFLKYTFLMDKIYPKRLKRILYRDGGISLRFRRTTMGWTKYKPLLYYILNKNNYREVIDKAKIDLEYSVKEISTLYPDCDVTDLIDVLNEYDSNVEKHYEEYMKVNELWNKIKYDIKKGDEIKIG